ncbi:acylneuraminate cytidylyltransferase family protein [Desulforhopalus sp. 52FAK]
MKKNICFIPARSGSKRLKGKNLSLFKGKTLVANTIEQAIESKIFDHIILSSDDEEMLAIGSSFGIELHNRSKDMSTDYTTILDVIQHVIKTRPISEDSNIGLLLTTCPLRSINDIETAYKIFKKADFRHSVVSVKKNETPVQLSWKKVNDYLEPMIPEEYYKTTRKQDHFDTYCYNDAIIFDSASNFLEQDRNLFGKSPIPYLMPWERSFPIDYDFQLKICQLFGEMEER